MRLRKPLITTAAALALVLMVFGSAMVALESRWFSAYLSDHMSERLGQQVQWEGPLHIDWSISPTLRVEQFRIDNPEWAKHDVFAAADTIITRIDLPQIFRGRIAIGLLELEQPEAHFMHSAEHGSNWAFWTKDKEEKEPLLKLHFKEILVAGGELTFLQPEQNTEVTATVSSREGKELRVTGKGQLQGEPIELVLTGDPLQEAVNRAATEGGPTGAYTLTGRIDWHEHHLQLNGATESVTELSELQFDLQAEGPDARTLSQLWGHEAYAAPYQLEAYVQYQQGAWTVRRLNAQMGDSEARGHIAYHTDGRRPKLMADLQISSLNLDNISVTKAEHDTSPIPQEEAQRKPWPQMLGDKVEPLRQYNADVVLRIGRLQKRDVVVQNLHASVEIDAGKLTVSPLHFEIGEGVVTLTGQLNATRKLPTGNASLEVQSVDIGKALAAHDYDTLGKIGGELTVQLDQRALRINDSRLRYWDQDSVTDIEAKISSRRSSKGAHKVVVEASGQLNGKESQLHFVGGPLLNIDAPNKPYPLTLNLTFADNTVEIGGTVTQLLHPQDADLNIHAVGGRPDQLNHIAGVDLPYIQPFQLDAHLLREDESWYLRDIRAEAGNSDLAGDVRWTHDTDRQLMVWANLYSQQLDFDDLTATDDARPSGETTHPSEEPAVADESEDSRVLPDEKLPSQRLRGITAHIQYESESVIASGVPMDEIILDLTLEDGVVELAPLSFGVGRGAVRMELWADTTTTPTGGHFDLEVSRVSINDVLAPLDIADESLGLIGGQGDFNFTGASIAQALANLQGELHLVMTDGQLDATLVEAIGLDGGELFFSLFGEEPEPVDIQCAYARLNSTSGVIDVRSFTLATTDSNIIGDGEINLEDETFELVIEAHPKDFSVLSGSSPIRFHGSFSNPKIDVVSDELIGRGALAAIGVAAFPPAALLPLVELGETEGQNGCQQAIASAESMAAQ